MLLYNLTLLLLLLYTNNAFCAVLTATTSVYIPLNHGVTGPAGENGVLSFVGGGGGITTFILTEPQNAELRATLIEGEGFVILLDSVGPNESLSLSCAKQATDAVCLVFNTNPEDHLFAFSTTTDAPLDSIALLEIGLPAPPTPAPAPAPTPAPAPQQPPSNPASSSAGGNQNGGAGGGGTGGAGTSNSPTSTASSQQTQTGGSITTGSTSNNSPSDIPSQSTNETQSSQSAPALIPSLPGLPPVDPNNSNQGISPGMPGAQTPSGAMRLAIDVFRPSVLSLVSVYIFSLF